MTLLQALDRVKFLLLEGQHPETKVDVVLWDAFHDSVGVRVAEVTWTRGTGGSWCSQADMPSASLIFAVERHILDLMHFPDDAIDSEFRLQRELHK